MRLLQHTRFTSPPQWQSPHRWWLCVPAGWLIFAGKAAAHVGFESDTEVRLHPDRIEVVTHASIVLAWRLLGDQAPPEAD
jgi:hypothetical protein